MSDKQDIQILQPGDRIVLHDTVPLFDTAKYAQMRQIAMMMAHSNMTPAEVRGPNIEVGVANCMIITNIALRWGMDPTAVAMETFFVSGRPGFTGKVVSAAVNSSPDLIGNLTYKFSIRNDESEGGENYIPVDEDQLILDSTEDLMKLRITCTGNIRDVGERPISGTFARWHSLTKGGKIKDIWLDDPVQMLTYRAARVWARRWMPSRLMGVYTPEEIELMQDKAERMKDVTPPSTVMRKVESKIDVPPPPPVEETKTAAVDAEPQSEVVGDNDEFNQDDWLAVFENRVTDAHTIEQLKGLEKYMKDFRADLDDEGITLAQHIINSRKEEISGPGVKNETA